MPFMTGGEASGPRSDRDPFDAYAEELDFAEFLDLVTPDLYRHLFTEDGGQGLKLPTRSVGGRPRVAVRTRFTNLSRADVALALRPIADRPYPPKGLETQLLDGRGQPIRLHTDRPGRAVVGRSPLGEPCFALALDEPPGGGGDLYLIRFMAPRHVEAARTHAEIANLLELVQVTIGRSA